MRSILFKLSDKEALEFEVIRESNLPDKLTPRKFFLAAMRAELDKISSDETLIDE